MAGDKGNQPPEHGPQAQPADDEPQARQHLDEPIVVGEPEPKSAESTQRSKQDNRFTLLAASITALAGILGAGVGGVASGYYSNKAAQRAADASIAAAQRAADAQIAVTQTSITAQAEAAQTTRRQTAYANFLGDLIDVTAIEANLSVEFADLPSSRSQLDDNIDKFNDAHKKLNVSFYLVSLVESPGVKQERTKIQQAHDQLDAFIQHLEDESQETTAPPKPETDDLLSRTKHMQDLINEFITAGQNDMK